MVRYIESNEINKRLILGYYLFLVLVGFTVILGPTGGGIPISITPSAREHEFAAPDSDTFDLEECNACHPNEVGNWTGTGHANAAHAINATHVGIGSHFETTYVFFNTSCAECHTTDIDGDGNWDVLGVTCFSCHNITTPWVDYSGEVCADCHSGEGEHPYQYLIWQNSAHANSLDVLRTSPHAASYCMHCETTEAFIHQQNLDMIGNIDTTFDPEGDYNSISCPACHAVHANWSTVSPAMIRSINSTELCGTCHVGSHHPMYQVWTGSPHDLVGVECIDCHGYDLTPGENVFLNHTFVVNPDIACGQDVACHEGEESWTLDQLESIQSDFDNYTDFILNEANNLLDAVDTYNSTPRAIHTLANNVAYQAKAIISTIEYYIADGSHGFHDPAEIMNALDVAYADLLDLIDFFHQYGISTDVSYTTTATTTSLPSTGAPTTAPVTTPSTEPSSSTSTTTTDTTNPFGGLNQYMTLIITIGSLAVILVFSALICRSRRG